MEIRFADINDLKYLKEKDKHISAELLERKVCNREIIIAYKENTPIGWLRYGLFWDNTPFMNLLFIEKDYRQKGYGSEIVRFWEEELSKAGYTMVMTSTLSDEEAQFFYRKNGYRDCGCLILENEAAELLFMKKI